MSDRPASLLFDLADLINEDEIWLSPLAIEAL